MKKRFLSNAFCLSPGPVTSQWWRHVLGIAASVVGGLTFTLVQPVPALADEISTASAGVVRVLSIAENLGEMSGAKGTGFAISPRLIVTNSHVVENAFNADGRTFVAIVPPRAAKPMQARILAYDADKDLAVLELGSGSVPTTLLVSNFELPEGARVTALGYPGNVDRATDANELQPRAPVRSGGNFSNLDQVNGIKTILHTASINTGNSGGPLTDDCGRVVGVNTFITADNNNGASYSFAVAPSELLSFLASNGIRVDTSNDACITEAQVAAQKALDDKDKVIVQKQRDAELALKRLQAEQTQQQLRMEKIQEQRENYMAAALVLLILAAIAFGIFLHRNSRSENGGQKGALIGALVLAGTAAGLFLQRPSLHDGNSVEPSTNESSSLEKADGLEQTVAAETKRASASYVCTLDEQRSSFEGDGGGNIPLLIDKEGCVNRKTPYANSHGQLWQRISVLAQDYSLVRMSFDRSSRRFIKQTWIVDPKTLSTAATIRGESFPKTCGLDERSMSDFARAQSKVLALLPNEPNEIKTYNCAAE